LLGRVHLLSELSKDFPECGDVGVGAAFVCPCFFTAGYHEGAFGIDVSAGFVETFGEFGGGGDFDFKCQAPFAARHEKIKFSAMGSPVEPGLPIGQQRDDLLNHKAFPTGAADRMSTQGVIVRNTQQLVQKPAVAQINLRALDEPLADIHAIRFQSADDKSLLKNR
jgi:hypothetical protein